MQARRTLLILAIALLVTAVAASFVPRPTPEETPPEDQQGANSADRDSPRAGSPDVRAITLDARQPPRTEQVPAERQVVVTVRARDPGQVEVDDLGLVAQVAPLAPASFDLFTDRTGAFDFVYEPVEGPPRRVGTIVVGRQEKADSQRPSIRPGERRTPGGGG